ncbi:MAG: oligosaccharide flippase family protein, partial [Sphingomonadaceae bacterium]
MNEAGPRPTGSGGMHARQEGLVQGLVRRARASLPVEALGGMAVKVTNAIASFVVSIIIARVAGAETVGHYALAIAAATLAGIVALRGLDAIALREIAGDLRQRREGRARYVLGALSRQIWLSSVIVSGLCLAVLLLLPVAEWLNASRGALFAGAIGVMVVVAFRMTIGVARGTGQPLLGNFTEAMPSY